MKIILSRKGFDSEYGRQPSPILPDGTLLSLPIPQPIDKMRFSELFYEDKSYLEIITELKPSTKHIDSDSFAHLDPDLRKNVYKTRLDNWKPIFGQSGAAQGKLKNEFVEKNDIFLFFGWFKQTELIRGKLSYKKDSPDLHIIFGYLQIGEIFQHGDKFPDYSLAHSHTDPDLQNSKLITNCIYIANEKLSLNTNLKGANVLNYDKSLVLTKEGLPKSKWNVPDFFSELEISYHNSNSFKDGYFQSVARGQEFVIKKNENLLNWTRELIEQNYAY
jgi:hypothetical protein